MMTNGLFLAQDVIFLLVLVLDILNIDQDSLLKYIMVMKSMIHKRFVHQKHRFIFQSIVQM